MFSLLNKYYKIFSIEMLYPSLIKGSHANFQSSHDLSEHDSLHHQVLSAHILNNFINVYNFF